MFDGRFQYGSQLFVSSSHSTDVADEVPLDDEIPERCLIRRRHSIAEHNLGLSKRWSQIGRDEWPEREPC
jgi:hypothetical protein